MALQDYPMADLEQQMDGIRNITSPQASVDVSSKDRGIVQEELERRLKQRVGRQNLVERNILPPLALPTAPKLFTQTQQLQKARLADNLQKKLRNRPDHSDLMQLNILPDLQMNIDPGLQAKQLQLRKSKLADQLNDKIANRPGPLQLLKEGILNPVLGDMVKEYDFEPPENSSEAKGLSPYSETSPPKEVISPQSSEASNNRKLSDSSISPAPSPDEAKSPIKSPYSQTQSPSDFTGSYPPLKATATPGIISSGIGKAPSPSQARKSAKKQNKPYRKLRYHEYVPPSKNNGKGGKTTPKPPPKSDSPYSLLLQQQQMFLQLQVLQQQYPNGVLMQKLPDLLSSLSKDHKALALAAVKGRVPVTSPSADGTNRPSGMTSSVPQLLQVDQPNKHNVSTIRFDDLKVNDLKAACKELGMIVSGKKAELVERLLEHNKGMLPSIALPDGLNKDTKRQSFSGGHTSSVDSQHSVSSALSPKSPSTSPVFTFPSDHRGGQSSHGIPNGMKPPSNPPPSRVESMPAMPLPEVFPATSLQQEFDEMIEQQKLNYLSRRGPVAKNLAPRPELNGLVAIRVPPAYSSAHNTQLDNSQMPSARAKGSTLPLRSDSSKFLMADKSSRSLPSSPQPLSPGDGILSLMDDTPAPDDKKQLTSSISNSSVSTSIPISVHGSISNAPLPTVSESVFLVPSSNPKSIVTPAPLQSSNSDSSFFQTKIPMRPNRSSVPVQPIHAKVHPMNPPPSYGSQLMQRSISLSGPPHHMQGAMGPPRLHTGASFGSDISDIVSPPSGEVAKPDTPDHVLDHQGGGYGMDVPMDTDHNLSEIFEILRADGTVTDVPHPPQPTSLPAYPHIHHPSHNPHHHTSHGSPTKLNMRHDAVQSDSIMLGGVMPFGNPPLGVQNRTGSDICLNVPREGHRSSTGSLHGTNVMLSEDLGWLDLDGSNTFGVSPTMNSGFSNLSRNSNPGSLQHDQFHMNFLDDSMHHTELDGGMRSLNQDFNSGVPVNGMHSFLDTGIPHPSGLFPASEESTLLELGLSTS